MAKLDDILLLRIGNDDMAAFEELYYLTAQTLYAFILSIIRNHQDAQDIMHDTYLKIRAGAHLYQPQGKPLAWIFTIAKNLSYMKLRDMKRSTYIDTSTMDNDIALSESLVGEDRMVLQIALDILSLEERQIVILHAVTGLKHREIADILGIPLSTVLSKYNRSLMKLKKYFVGKELR